MGAVEKDVLLILCVIISYKVASTASQDVRLISLLLVYASQKIVHNVRNEMAEFVLPLRKRSKDSLTRQGM